MSFPATREPHVINPHVRFAHALSASAQTSLTSHAFAQHLDKHDQIGLRSAFHIPQARDLWTTEYRIEREQDERAHGNGRDESEGVYMAGNSLGLQPLGTEKLLLQEMNVWRRL